MCKNFAAQEQECSGRSRELTGEDIPSEAHSAPEHGRGGVAGTPDAALRETSLQWPTWPEIFDILGACKSRGDASGLRRLDIVEAPARYGDAVSQLSAQRTREFVSGNLDNGYYVDTMPIRRNFSGCKSSRSPSESSVASTLSGVSESGCNVSPTPAVPARVPDWMRADFADVCPARGFIL